MEEGAGWMRVRLTLIAALCFLVLAPASATAVALESFELGSRLVDPSTGGGQLTDDRAVPRVNVQLPDGYDADSKRGYPVLWLLHGAYEDADRWLDDFAELAADVPAILVMPDGARFGMYANWWNGGARGHPAWASYHLKTVRREIESRYAIRPGRRWHTIAGISMGGQGTLRYAAMLPGYFGSAVGFSSAFQDMQSDVAYVGLDILPVEGIGSTGVYETIFGPPQSPYAEGNNPQALAANYQHTRLYLTSGNGVNCPEDPPTSNPTLDGVTESLINAQQAPFAAALRATGADVTEVTTCGIHTQGVWDRAFAAARAWGLFGPVPERPRSWTYRTIATAGEMWGLRFRFTAPPSEVAEFKRSGRALSAAGSGEVRISDGRGCRFSAALPFERRIPRRCLGRH
jgi:S-formylglutathione hydrolase FrmB